jgi:hypothetical protein
MGASLEIETEDERLKLADEGEPRPHFPAHDIRKRENNSQQDSEKNRQGFPA